MIRNEIKAGAALLLLRKVTHEEQQCGEKTVFWDKMGKNPFTLPQRKSEAK